MPTPIPSDQQIRANIAQIITDGLASLYSSLTVPRVHSHWILSLNIGENAAMLKALSGTTMGKVHSYMIGLQSINRERPDLKDGFNTQSLQKIGPTRRNIVKNYKVWAFRQLNTGTSASNSENDLILELESISDFVDKEPTLRFTENSVRGHTSLNFGNIDTFAMGELQVHIAQGNIAVVLHRHL